MIHTIDTFTQATKVIIGDRVHFVVQGRLLDYEVRHLYLNCSAEGNRQIFNALGINYPMDFARRIYKDTSLVGRGDFPEYANLKDASAIILEFFNRIKQQQRMEDEKLNDIEVDIDSVIDDILIECDRAKKYAESFQAPKIQSVGRVERDIPVNTRLDMRKLVRGGGSIAHSLLEYQIAGFGAYDRRVQHGSSTVNIRSLGKVCSKKLKREKYGTGYYYLISYWDNCNKEVKLFMPERLVKNACIKKVNTINIHKNEERSEEASTAGRGKVLNLRRKNFSVTRGFRATGKTVPDRGRKRSTGCRHQGYEPSIIKG